MSPEFVLRPTQQELGLPLVKLIQGHNGIFVAVSSQSGKKGKLIKKEQTMASNVYKIRRSHQVG
jgi:hypothetical protein